METRIAQIGIIVENKDSVAKLNAILHDYGDYIIGRMGIPYREKKVSIISIVVDAPNDVISAMTGKIGMISDVNIKTIISLRTPYKDESKALTGFMLKKYTATFLSFMGLLSPVFASISSWILIGERPSWIIFGSTALLSTGLFIVYRAELRQGYIKQAIPT